MTALSPPQLGEPAKARTATFVGRDRELAVLTALLVRDEVPGVLVVGPPGVGRTTLLRRWATTTGVVGNVRWITATHDTALVPLGSFAGLVPPDAPRQQNPVDRVVAGLVALRRLPERTVLIIDDADRLDSTSLTLIHHLVAEGRVFVAASVSSAERVPDTLTNMVKDSSGERLLLDPLDQRHLLALAAHHLEGHIDPGAARSLVQLCDGRPDTLLEAIGVGVADGFIGNVEGVWQLHLPDVPSVQLTDLVERVMGPLSAPDRACLTLLAVAERLTSGQLETLDVARTRVDELEQKRILASTAVDGELEFYIRQPIVAHVVRHGLGQGRAQSIAASLARALERSVQDPVRLASWHVDGGVAVDSGLLLRGAVGAEHRYEYELALRLADAATGAGGGFEPGFLGARMAGLLQGPDAEDERLERLVSVAGNDDERGRLAVARLENLTMSTTRRSDGLRIAAEADASISDPQWRDRIEVLRIVGTVIPVSGPRVAGDLLLRLLDRNTEPAARASIAYTTSYCLGRVGQIEAALDVARNGYTEHLKVSDTIEWAPWQHLWAQCEALAAAGRYAEAEQIAREQYLAGLEANDIAARAWFARYLAASGVATGPVRTAAEFAREAVSLYSQLGKPRQATWAAISLAGALALTGRPDAAEAALARGIADHNFTLQVDALNARAWIAVARGQLAEARDLLTRAADQGRASSDIVGAIKALHDLARLGYAKQVRNDLEAVSRGFEGELTVARRAHVEGLCDHDASMLLHVSETFAAMGTKLLAAEAAFDAAVAWRKDGNTRNAVAAERSGAMLVSACEGAQTPALQRVQTRLRLTPAELDTAMLASAGYTNRQIAETQHLSIKTVKNRLLNIYVKLGATGRADLTAILYPKGQPGPSSDHPDN